MGVTAFDAALARGAWGNGHMTATRRELVRMGQPEVEVVLSRSLSAISEGDLDFGDDAQL